MKNLENLKSSDCSQNLKYCVICGKKLSEDKINRHKNTCSMSCAQKLAQNRPEVKAKRSASLKKVESKIQNRPEVKQRKAKSMKLAWQNLEFKQKMSDAQKIAQNKPEVAQRKSNSSKEFYSVKEHRDKLKAIRNSKEIAEKIKQSNINTWSKIEKLKQHSLTMKKAQNSLDAKKKHSIGAKLYLSNAKNKEKFIKYTHSLEAHQKSNETKKKNGSYSKSRWENYSYQLLLTKFNENDIERQYYDKERYPFSCDFYIKSLDLFIECHYSEFHQYEPFDKTNDEHLKRLKDLEERAKLKFEQTGKESRYHKMIYTWTDLDARKRQCAKDNKLNQLAFYNLIEFERWLKLQKEEADLQAGIED